jgi:hypothetical protein
MKEIVLSPPAFGFIVGTRIALAVGVGLLASQRLPDARRRAIGAALVAFGALTTIPAVMTLARSRRRSGASSGSPVNRDAGLIGASRFPRKGDDDLE